LQFRILGPLEVVAAGSPVPLGGPKMRALLGFLLLHRGETVGRERLIDALWGERPPKAVAAELRVYVSKLRKAIGAGRLETRSDGYALLVENDDLDSEQFERLLAEGSEALRVGEPARAEAVLARALGLWRGPPLADFALESFARNEIARLEELHLRATAASIEGLLALGRHREALNELQALIAEHPLDQTLRAHSMVALYRSGRPAEALAAYRDVHRLLRDELGLEPSRELRDLERAILRQDLTLAGNAPSPPRQQRSPDDERRLVTVLSVALDAVGDEELDPEDAQEVVAPSRRRLWAEVERHGGRVLTSLGDVVVAVFGVPVVHDDDPERAIRTALEICERARVAAVGSVRVAVESGEVLVAHTSDAAPAEPDVTGDVVNAVLLMLGLAPADTILVGPRAFESTRDGFEYEDPPQDATVGRTWRGRTWRTVVGLSEAGGEPSPRELVGRERELALLASALERTLTTQKPTLVAVIGEAGIGKSRLVEEFGRQVRSLRRARWFQGHALPYGDSVGWSAFSQIVKAAAGILESDSKTAAERKLLGTVTRAADTAEADWLTKHLRPLVGLGGETSSSASGRPETLAAWRRFLECLARRRPHVLILEDVHWADDAILEFVNGIVEWIPSAPVLVVLTARPEILESHPDWPQGVDRATSIRLAPLSEAEVGQLLDRFLDNSQLALSLRSKVLAKAGGNPLYAEQYASLARERPLDPAVDVPDTVRMVIAARIDGLPASEKRLLRSAAVFPDVFWTGAVAAVDAIERRSADVHLHALERKQFIDRRRESSVAGEAELAFRHVLLRDVAYGQLTRGARADRHQRAASWIEALGRSHDHADMIAHHYESALALQADEEVREALRPRARDAYVDAAVRAFALHAFEAAATFYRRAVELTAKHDARRPQLLFQLGRSLYFSGDRAAERALHDAQIALLTTGERHAAAEACALMAELWWHRGRRRELEEQLERALEFLGEHGPPEVRARVLETVARFRAKTGDHAAAIGAAREALLAVKSIDAPELLANILITLGVSRWQMRDRRGVADIERGLDLAVRSNAFTAAPRGYSNLAHVLAQDGDPTRPQELLLASQHVAERLGERHSVRRTRANIIGYATYGRGDWDEALRLANEFIAECETSPHVSEHQVRTVRAAIWLGRGEADAAIAEDERALELARAAGTQSTRWQLAANAFVYAEVNQLERARVYAEEVLSLGHGERAFWAGQVFMLGTVADRLGIDDRMRALIGPPESDWFEERTLRAVLAGDYEHAATMMGAFGRRTVEALLRLRAGQSLLARNNHADATAQLEAAMSFYRSVAAHHYVAQIDALLAGIPARLSERRTPTRHVAR
jgi:DNA-binding SARP family transcriptional activator